MKQRERRREGDKWVMSMLSRMMEPWWMVLKRRNAVRRVLLPLFVSDVSKKKELKDDDGRGKDLEGKVL